MVIKKKYERHVTVYCVSFAALVAIVLVAGLNYLYGAAQLISSDAVASGGPNSGVPEAAGLGLLAFFWIVVAVPLWLLAEGAYHVWKHDRIRLASAYTILGLILLVGISYVAVNNYHENQSMIQYHKNGCPMEEAALKDSINNCPL